MPILVILPVVRDECLPQQFTGNDRHGAEAATP
jgi:hypothetical protein